MTTAAGTTKLVANAEETASPIASSFSHSPLIAAHVRCAGIVNRGGANARRGYLSSLSRIHPTSEITRGP
jgi:hypothetical protein